MSLESMLKIGKAGENDYFYEPTQVNMKKGLIAGLIVLATCMGITAHEFWIQPSRTHVLVGQRVPLQLTIGSNFTGDRWKGEGNRIVAYNHYYRNAFEELLLSLEPGNGLVNLPDFIPTTEGTHMLTLATNYKFLETEADAFNDYLKEDGLMEAYKYRVANNEKFKKGREKFSRCAKVLIQAGEETDHTFRERTNLHLEIIPDKNPYNHDIEQGITFRVLYEGNPLPDAMVKWYHRHGEKVETDFLYTSNKGEVTFSAAEPGLYMISLVHMIRLNNDPAADWQSTFSSLVFGREEY
jgi:uncharacterized GH25 family protein